MLAKVFKSGHSQAVRLPKILRLDVNEVDITRDGDNLVLKPIKQPKPSVADAFHILAQMPDDFMANGRDDKPPQERKGFDV